MTRRRFVGQRITRREYYALGGPANGRLYRVADRAGRWRYFIISD